MSNLALPVPPISDSLTSEPDISPAVPRRWLSQVIYNTVGRTGTRIGLAWIALVAFGAITAPLLANSFPLLVKMNGKWSSPALKYLTVSDVSLLAIVPVAAIAMVLFRRKSRLFRSAVFIAVMAVVFILSLVFVKPPLVSGYEDYRLLEAEGKLQWVLHAPVAFSPDDHLRDQFDINNTPPWPPSRQHLLGTEENSEDILSIMIYACRIAMAIGFISTGLSLIIGVLVGSQMGYFSGIVDLLGMRLVEVFTAIPQLYLLLAFCAVFERNIYMVMAIIGLTSWTEDARFVRAEFLKLRNQDFVQAAIAAGLPLRSVLFRHILPNALAPLLVSASFGIASAILAESYLSFLGIGLPVDAASWGRLLSQAVGSGGGFHWWLATFPGLAIFLTVFAYNVIGESIRDALDPKLRQRD